MKDNILYITHTLVFYLSDFFSGLIPDWVTHTKDKKVIRRCDSECKLFYGDTSTTFTQCTPEATKYEEITQNGAITLFKVIQGHRFWYQ